MTWAALEPSPGRTTTPTSTRRRAPGLGARRAPVRDPRHARGHLRRRLRLRRRAGVDVRRRALRGVRAEGPVVPQLTDPNVIACVDHFFTSADLEAKFAALWPHVAQRLATAPAVIGFDVLNEPNWGSYPIFTFERDRLAPLYDQVVPPSERPHRTGSRSSSRRRAATSASRPPCRSRRFPTCVRAALVRRHGRERRRLRSAHRQLILDNVADLAGEATRLGAGLWIGEYGGIAANPGIVDYMAAQYDAAGAVAASTMYWAYDKSDGYGLLIRRATRSPSSWTRWCARIRSASPARPCATRSRPRRDVHAELRADPRITRADPD